MCFFVGWVRPIVQNAPGERHERNSASRPPRISKAFAKHDQINHTAKVYVDRDDPSIHTNTVEGVFARVKRGINGTYHAVSREHLHRYVNQFAFAYNTRRMNDGERFAALVKETSGNA